jgi:hypothetical protein
MEMTYTSLHSLPYPAALERAADVLEDLSWGNDVTDKVVFLLGGKVYRLWVNESMPEHREYPDDSRYILEVYGASFEPRAGDGLAEWHDGDADDGAWEEVHTTEIAEHVMEWLNLDVNQRWSSQNDRAMAEIGFQREGLGGNLEGYVKRDPTIGEVTVTSAHHEGQAPVARYEQVLVTFSGFQHSEALLSLQLPFDTFVKQVKAGGA